MEEKFKAFAKFGNSKMTEMTLSSSDKWMKQAGVIDGKKITTTDTAICFSKLKSKALGYEDYNKFLKILAKEKNINLEELKNKLLKCDTPGTSGTTKPEESSTVQRLTDTSKYTGSHKERFDKSGKGKGVAGREDRHENTGYVQGFKNKDTYDKTKK